MRKPISKRLRFEIFKRDGFQCTYCGRTPPTVVLNVDHIEAVVSGGNNDPSNLTTSCFDCNAGKSDIPLGTSFNQVAIERESARLEQLKALNKLRDQLKRVAAKNLGQASNLWITLAGLNPAEYQPCAAHKLALQRYLERLPFDEVAEAIRITLERLSHKSVADQIRYFCGVCNYKIRGERPLQKSYGYR